MAIAYIRPEKSFITIHEQLQYINSYAVANDIVIDDEFIDHISQNKRLNEREYISEYFQSKQNSVLLIYDIWVLSIYIEDIVQILSCLLKNNFKVHIIKHSVIISQQSNAMLVLGIIEQLRQKIYENSKRSIGRPKGSRSGSKFDVYISDILQFLKEKKSVSEMARLLGVSRSSLKDYIESRELREVVGNSLVKESQKDMEEHLINNLVCSNKIQKER
jgi:DNA invertase Pin-like site-specific DNA recombinase